MRKVKYAILGAGTVGLTALSLIKKQTQDFVLIQEGEMGTTCARVGCMPSKALIHAANHFYHARHAADFGVIGGETLQVDHAKVMQRVRAFRDRFTGGIKSGTTDSLNPDNLILGAAKFVGCNQLEVNGERIEAERIIIGTGSRPMVPAAWRERLGSRLITSDEIFELDVLPKRLAVIGLGVIGLELGQAMSRLGVDVLGFEAANALGGMRHPVAIKQVADLFGQELELHLGQAVDLSLEQDQVIVTRGDQRFQVDAVLVTIGRQSNIDKLNLDQLGVALDQKGFPPFDPETMQIADLPIFIAGDASGYRPILHEAGDEGKIATLNAMAFPSVTKHPRRTPLGITFVEPGLAYFGARFDELDPESIVTAEFDLYRNNGRAIVMGEDHGQIILFADKVSGCLVGGELVMPQAEHLAHLLSWCVQNRMTVTDILQMPFYHPVLEEAVESALKLLRAQLK